MKATHDKRGVNTHVYTLGDLVWFNIKNLGMRHDSRRHKLVPKYWGPFNMINLFGQNAVLLGFPQHLRHIHLAVSVTSIKPYVPRSGEPLPVHYGGEEEFELHLITDFNILNNLNGVMLQTKWISGSNVKVPTMQILGMFHLTFTTPRRPQLIFCCV
jgi:hypothetical protein